MTAQLVLLHTRAGDADIYETVKAALAPTVRIKHVVRRDWRARAQREGLTWQLRREIESFVRSANRPVICTCLVLAEAAEFAGANRMDRPAMREAACGNGTLLLVTVETSAMQTARAALEEAMAAHGNKNAVLPLVLHQFMGLYERGDTSGFHAALAAAVIEAFEARPDLTTVILAESCMHPAARLLDGVGPAILTLPDIGMRKMLGLQDRASLGDPMTT